MRETVRRGAAEDVSRDEVQRRPRLPGRLCPCPSGLRPRTPRGSAPARAPGGPTSTTGPPPRRTLVCSCRPRAPGSGRGGRPWSSWTTGPRRLDGQELPRIHVYRGPGVDLPAVHLLHGLVHGHRDGPPPPRRYGPPDRTERARSSTDEWDGFLPQRSSIISAISQDDGPAM